MWTPKSSFYTPEKNSMWTETEKSTTTEKRTCKTKLGEMSDAAPTYNIKAAQK